MPTSAKHWCFTLNNYTDDETAALTALGTESSFDLVYLVFGRETGESGTAHLQGFVSFSRRKTLNQCRQIISTRAHLEVAKGTPQQAATYCKKDGDFEEFGNVPQGQGKRSDLAAVVDSIKQGKNMREIAEENPSAVIRYGTGIQRLRMLHRPARVTPPQIKVFWGKTGTGKTRRVWEFADHSQLWVHPGDKWFDGYDGQPLVLFDDFDGSWFKLSYFLRLLDRYPMMVPVKGGYAHWCPTTIFITSNIKPEEWFINSHEEHKAALQRRLTEFGNVEHCSSSI